MLKQYKEAGNTKMVNRLLKYPLKGFYTFFESAHSPIYEEPEKVKQFFIEDVLEGKTGLADK